MTTQEYLLFIGMKEEFLDLLQYFKDLPFQETNIKEFQTESKDFLKGYLTAIISLQSMLKDYPVFQKYIDTEIIGEISKN